MKLRFVVHDSLLVRVDVLESVPEEIEEITIPHSTPSGNIIERIDKCYSLFAKLKEKGCKTVNRLVIEEGIRYVNPSAFSNINILIKCVVWPKTCITIPYCCFYNSNIECVENIQDVIGGIGRKAFQCSGLRTITWPPKCKTISDSCFKGSKLEAIYGIERVTRIEKNAFKGTNIQNFSWPINCSDVRENVFESCLNLRSVTFNSKVLTVDLSAFVNCPLMNTVDLAPCVFLAKVKRCKGNHPNVNYSYYLLGGVASAD